MMNITCWQCYHSSFLARPHNDQQSLQFVWFLWLRRSLICTLSTKPIPCRVGRWRTTFTTSPRWNLQTTKLLHEVLGLSCKYNNTTQFRNVFLLRVVGLCACACVNSMCPLCVRCCSRMLWAKMWFSFDSLYICALLAHVLLKGFR